MTPSTLDLSALKNALSSLEDGYGAAGNSAWLNAQSEAVKRTLVAGVIQNFEFVYELSVKMMRRRLELDAASPSDIDQAGYRDLVRIAAERGLVSNVEAWFSYRELRNITAHTYDQKKADLVYHNIPAFISDARRLLAQLEAHNG